MSLLQTIVKTLLHVACHSGHASTAEQLILHGIDVNARMFPLTYF